MNSIKILLSILVTFIWVEPCFSQAKKKFDSIENTVQKISQADLVNFANGNELISEIKSSDFYIKIYRVRNGFIGGDEDFLGNNFDLYIAITKDKNKRLYKATGFQRIRDLKWLEIEEEPEFSFNYAGSSHTRTARFKVYLDKIERLH